MNDTRIERLLQATAPAIDRTRSDTARDGNRHDKFDSHMREIRGATNAHAQPRTGDTNESDAPMRPGKRASSPGGNPSDTGETQSDDQKPAVTPNGSVAPSNQGADDDREDTSAAEAASSDGSNMNLNGSVPQTAQAIANGATQASSSGATEPSNRDGSIVANGVIPYEATTSPAVATFPLEPGISGSGSQAESNPADLKSGTTANESWTANSAAIVDAVTADSAPGAEEGVDKGSSVGSRLIAQTEVAAKPADGASDIDLEIASAGLASNMTAGANAPQAPARQHARLGKSEDSLESAFDLAPPGAVESDHSPTEPNMSLETTANAEEVAEREAFSRRTDEVAPRQGGSSDLRIDGIVTSLNRLHRTGSGGRGNPSSESHDGPRVDTGRFVDRVAKAFNSAQERGGTLTLRLSPVELGSVRLEIAVKDGAMTAAVETESNLTRKVLLEHLPALRERLAEQNIRIERFDVDVRSDSSGRQAGGGNHGEANYEPPSPPRHGRLASTSGPVAPSAANTTQEIGNAALNLVV